MKRKLRLWVYDRLTAIRDSDWCPIWLTDIIDDWRYSDLIYPFWGDEEL